MGFTNLTDKAALVALNDFLSSRSYIEGYLPSQADTVVFKAMSGPPPADMCHATRWYNHIKSYGSEVSSFPGVPKPLDAYGPASAAAVSKSDADGDDDDDIDLFGSDDEEEDEEEKKKKEAMLKAYHDKKQKKPAVVAKSSVVLDVKPWDDETDMKEIEDFVRAIQMDGLLWGKSQLVPLAYGIKKLQIGCVVEDEKVSIEELSEKITDFEDCVQSVDVAAFNKI